MEIDISSLSSRNDVTGELDALKNDRMMTDRAVASQQNRWQMNLQGAMGNDINDVLSGKVKVNVPFKLKLKYYFNKIIDILVRIV